MFGTFHFDVLFMKKDLYTISAETLHKIIENTPSWDKVESLRNNINEDGVGTDKYERAYDKAKAFDLLVINTFDQQVCPILKQLTETERESLSEQLNSVVAKIKKSDPKLYKNYLQEPIEKLLHYKKENRKEAFEKFFSDKDVEYRLMVSRCFIRSEMFFTDFLNNVKANDLSLEQLLQFLRYTYDIKYRKSVKISFESISDWFGFNDQNTTVNWQGFDITKQQLKNMFEYFGDLIYDNEFLDGLPEEIAFEMFKQFHTPYKYLVSHSFYYEYSISSKDLSPEEFPRFSTWSPEFQKKALSFSIEEKLKNGQLNISDFSCYGGKYFYAVDLSTPLKLQDKRLQNLFNVSRALFDLNRNDNIDETSKKEIQKSFLLWSVFKLKNNDDREIEVKEIDDEQQFIISQITTKTNERSSVYVQTDVSYQAVSIQTTNPTLDISEVQTYPQQTTLTKLLAIGGTILAVISGAGLATAILAGIGGVAVIAGAAAAIASGLTAAICGCIQWIKEKETIKSLNTNSDKDSHITGAPNLENKNTNSITESLNLTINDDPGAPLFERKSNDERILSEI